jgi:putative phosphoesterase
MNSSDERRDSDGILDDIGPTTEARSFDPPLKIGVISDTHLYDRRGVALPPPVLDLFRRAEVGLIVHLGDANTRAVLEQLAKIAPVIAIPGNNDDLELHATLPESVQFTVGRFRFAALHGHGGRTARDEAIRRFRGRVDCVLVGHSHKPLIEQVDDTVLFNPGSATDRRWHEHFGVGLIHVTAERFEPDLVLYRDPQHLVNIDVSAETEAKQ